MIDNRLYARRKFHEALYRRSQDTGRRCAAADGGSRRHAVDLNAAGGVYYQAQGDTNPQQLADANLPNDMVTFFWNGARSLEAGKAVMQFMQTNAPAQGLQGSSWSTACVT